MLWVCCRPKNKTSGCSGETGEHPLKQWDLAALPEGQGVGGETSQQVPPPTFCPSERGEIQAKIKGVGEI